MKLAAAHLVPAVVCALSVSAWAAGDPKACVEGDKKACTAIGTGVAKEEPPLGDVDEMRTECEKTKDELNCSGWFREQVKEGCRSGKKPEACRALGEGEARRIAEEAKGTTEELEAKCKTKNQQACVDFAVRLLDDEPSEEDKKRAKALLDRGCKAGVGDGCGVLATLIMLSGKESDFRRGVKLMKRGCNLGSKLSCGSDRPPPQPKILRPREKSTGPARLDVLRADDVGQVVRDLTKLRRLLEQNCKLGYADACAELEKRDEHDPANEKDISSAELAAKIRKLERQAAAGPAPKK